MTKQKGSGNLKYDLVLIADLCADILVALDEAPEFGQVEKFVKDFHLGIGGSAAIFASQFKKLGGNPAFYGLTGKDEFGEILTKKLKDLGINTDFIFQEVDEKTPVGVGLIKSEDRAMLTYKGCLAKMDVKKIAESGILTQATHIHLCGFYLFDKLRQKWIPELEKWKKKGNTISLDTNWAPNGNWEDVHDVLPLVDVFIPNEEESIKISGKSDWKAAGHWLGQFCELVVIKRGALGASVFADGSFDHYSVPPSLLENLKIMDTTGAGDNFGAGFIYAWLNNNTVEKCVNVGLKCGTLSLAKMGGIEGQWNPEIENTGIIIQGTQNNKF